MQWKVQTATEATYEIIESIQNLAKAKHSILLLVSGGSALEIEASILSNLQETPHILGVLPVDERYGPAGHPDSNMGKLQALLPGDSTIAVYDILRENCSFDQTVDSYSSQAQELFAKADCIVGIFGIGPDGHTAGILPGSPATNDTISTVIGYNWQDFQRLTLGVTQLLQIDKAYALAYGEPKQQALDRLQKNDESFESLPAKLLYEIADTTIYNDYINSEG